MIKFFRKIRQKLLVENRLSKYFLYAIGEIVLVVIGILIALQVNNWNNEKADRVREKKILTEMVRNLKMNIEQFSAEIEHQDRIKQNIDIIVYQIKNEIPYHDSLGSKYASLAWTEEFNFANSAYETLQTTGLELISSDSLRENIINLFNVRYRKISDVIEKVSIADYNGLQSLWIKYIEYNKKGKAVVIDFDSLKKDRVFTNILSGRRVWKRDLINMYRNLITESQQLLQMIERELENKT